MIEDKITYIYAEGSSTITIICLRIKAQEHSEIIPNSEENLPQSFKLVSLHIKSVHYLCLDIDHKSIINEEPLKSL